jgi:ABC-type uncharacterized transport system ATPase subunit
MERIIFTPITAVLCLCYAFWLLLKMTNAHPLPTHQSTMVHKMISLSSVSVSIQSTTIISDLTIQLKSGVSYLITGKNGVGKTTLLNLIAGKIQPKSGLVSYDFIGPNLTWDERHELRKKNVHYVSTYALHELMSGPDLYYQQRYYTIEDSSPVSTVKDFFGERYKKLHEFDFPASFNIDHLLKLELTSP